MVDVESVSLSNILFITALFFVIVLLWCRRRTDKRLPPGPISWSAFGHIPQIILQGNRPLFEISLEWREKYGNLFLMKLGDARVVWVCGLELAREVLLRRGPKFDSRPNWMPLIKETRQNEGILRCMGAPLFLTHTFMKGNNFYDFLFASLDNVPFQNMVNS